MIRTVAESMVAPVRVASGTSLQDAAAAMRDADAQAAVIVDGGRARGLVTAEDVANALADGHDPSRTTADAVAERDAPVVHGEDTLVDAHQLMRVTQHRAVAVVGSRGECVGVLVDPEA